MINVYQRYQQNPSAYIGYMQNTPEELQQKIDECQQKIQSLQDDMKRQDEDMSPVKERILDDIGCLLLGDYSLSSEMTSQERAKFCDQDKSIITKFVDKVNSFYGDNGEIRIVFGLNFQIRCQQRRMTDVLNAIGIELPSPLYGNTVHLLVFVICNEVPIFNALDYCKEHRLGEMQYLLNQG